jgi:hypothetical protein
MSKFGQFCAKGSDWASIRLNLCLVPDQNVDETADTPSGILDVVHPLPKHVARVGQSMLDDGTEDLVFGLEMVVKIATRDVHRGSDIGKGRMCVALLIEELIGSIDDTIAGVRHGRSDWIRMLVLILGRAPQGCQA